MGLSVPVRDIWHRTCGSIGTGGARAQSARTRVPIPGWRGLSWRSASHTMSTEKRPKIASVAVAAAAALCLFIYSLDQPTPLPEESETFASVSAAPIGGRIEIDHGPSGLVRVAPRDVETDRDAGPPSASPEEAQPDPIDVAAAQASEARAEQTLRIIAMAQEQFREARSVDSNLDHLGEYGYLAELMGTAPLRNGLGDSFVDVSELNAFLPRDFAEVVSTSAGGACEVNGYLFSVYLPAAPLYSGEVEGLAEALHGGSGENAPDANQSALRWCAYAWPSSETTPPRRAFFLDNSGLQLSTANTPDSEQPYIGAAHAPRWDAAYVRPDMSGEAGGETTCDGNGWDR